MKHLLTLAIVSGFVFCGAASAGVLNVPGDYTQIHDAVQACASGDTVLVAAGTYYDCTHPTEGPESTPACVIMKSGVTLIGAGVDQTIIDAQDGGRGIFIDNVANCRVENLRIRRAYALIYGAGILIREVGNSVQITDVRVTECTDGGVICINNSSPTLIRVAMDNNSAKQGGGLAIEENSSPIVTDCLVNNNLAPSGAGIFIRTNCAPVLDGCIIRDNTITAVNTNGGGISVQGSTPTITNCDILDNTVDGYGGGIAFADYSGGLVENCTIQGNTNTYTDGLGGGIFASQSDPVLRNLVISGNTSSGYFGKGGGIHISFTPAPTVENCTIVANACGSNGQGGGIVVDWFAAPSIDKCIISDSTVGQGIYCENATPVISCSNIHGNAGGDILCGTDGGGNFSAAPLFCNAGNQEFGLTTESPCAPGNHPDGLCDDALIGAVAVGCNASAVELPERAELVIGNHPNPFNPRTTIFFELPQAGPATLRIYTLAGHLVGEKSWNSLPQGRSEFQWNGLDLGGRALSSGVYLYRVDTVDQSLSRRMSLIR
jgi:parallel beta-helix repeat protein